MGLRRVLHIASIPTVADAIVGIIVFDVASAAVVVNVDVVVLVDVTNSDNNASDSKSSLFLFAFKASSHYSPLGASTVARGTLLHFACPGHSPNAKSLYRCF